MIESSSMDNKQDEQKLVELLKQLKPGFLPFEIFREVARLVTLPIIEFVPLRSTENGVEVLLIHRGMDDLIWPDEWHTPGTVILPTDNQNNMYLAFDRILKNELKSTTVGKPYYVGSIFHRSKRGAEQSQIFWVEVLEKPRAGRFFSAQELPNKLINSQRKFIELAVGSFIRNKQTIRQ